MISGSEMQTADRNFTKLAEFLGIECRVFYLGNIPSQFDALVRIIHGKNNCVALSCRTLNNILKNYGNDYFINRLNEKISYMLIYDMKPGVLPDAVLQDLSNGIIRSISNFENNSYQYNISSDHNDICYEFSGFSFGPINNEIDFKLDVNEDSQSLHNIISINGHPLLAAMKKKSSEIFFLATDNIIDIETEIEEVPELKSYFSQLIPPMMFLKYVFGNKCWNNSNRYACLIIDDPLLKKKYGFLNYNHLMECMALNNFSSAIAFIPWNYKRTDKNVSELFKSHPQKLSICVHGCDHAKCEFGIKDVNQLNLKIKSATTKMIAHEKATGVTFDNVMVFPQGKFSKESMKVLKHNNYIAAVNTEIFPTELSQTNHLKISDYLDLAITNYECFPLFARNYPNDIITFVFTMFLGKPIFIVIHHDYLKDGYKNLVEFIKNLNSIRNDIRWRSVGDAIRNSYLLREESDDELYVKVYANSVIICNFYDLPKKMIITKYEKSTIPIKSVSINGTKVLHKVENNFLVINTHIAPKSSLSVEIRYMDYDLGKCQEEIKSFKKKLKTYVRRLLSEFRDNYISKNDFLLKMAKKLLGS
jgi:hypothetical protein